MDEIVETDEQYSMYSKEFGIIKDNLTLFKMQINMMQQQLKNLERSTIAKWYVQPF